VAAASDGVRKREQERERRGGAVPGADTESCVHTAGFEGVLRDERAMGMP
jgi:hypothetical protein